MWYIYTYKTYSAHVRKWFSTDDADYALYKAKVLSELVRDDVYTFVGTEHVTHGETEAYQNGRMCKIFIPNGIGAI